MSAYQTWQKLGAAFLQLFIPLQQLFRQGHVSSNHRHCSVHICDYCSLCTQKPWMSHLSAHSPQNLGHFPTAVKVQQTKCRVRLRAHSVATKSDILHSIFEVADAAARSAMQPCFIASIRARGEPQTGLLPTRLPRSQPMLIPTSPPTPFPPQAEPHASYLSQGPNPQPPSKT